jgi:hypothetical protein
VGDFWELYKIKAQRKPPQVGDVFLVQPFEDIYFFGKVFNENLFSNSVYSNMYDECIAVFIFGKCIKSKNIPEYFDCNLGLPLVGPMIISKRYNWSSGFLHTIGNVEFTAQEKSIDYGFEETFILEEILKLKDITKVNSGRYCNADGTRLSDKPEFCNVMGLFGYHQIGHWLHRTIADQPEILCEIMPLEKAKHLIEEAPNRKIQAQLTTFQKEIRPFEWIKRGSDSSLILHVGDYKKGVFETRKNDGFNGNGYDWEALAGAYIAQELPEYKKRIHFDSESGMFCAYSRNATYLKEFAVKFKKMCEDEQQFTEILSNLTVTKR